MEGEIKRRFLLGRKAMTNLDGVLKSRDITLPTKVRIVKAMVFPIVMYECESSLSLLLVGSLSFEPQLKCQFCREVFSDH